MLVFSVCVLFLIKLRWAKKKSINNNNDNDNRNNNKNNFLDSNSYLQVTTIPKKIVQNYNKE